MKTRETLKVDGVRWGGVQQAGLVEPAADFLVFPKHATEGNNFGNLWRHHATLTPRAKRNLAFSHRSLDKYKDDA